MRGLAAGGHAPPKPSGSKEDPGGSARRGKRAETEAGRKPGGNEMPRRKSAAYMSAGEQIAGTVLFVIYLLVLPFVTTPLFRLIGGLLGVTISTGLQNILYYYILFAATVIIFHGFLGRTSRHLVSCLLFALLHVWQFAVVNRDITYFLLMLQYLVPGLVLAWVYDRTGTLWTSIGLHAAANALSAWTLVA